VESVIEPSAVEKVPAEHFEQDEEPSLLTYVPNGHLMHCAGAVTNISPSTWKTP
jgi:hypothetical protein